MWNLEIKSIKSIDAREFDAKINELLLKNTDHYIWRIKECGMDNLGNGSMVSMWWAILDLWYYEPDND